MARFKLVFSSDRHSSQPAATTGLFACGMQHCRASADSGPPIPVNSIVFSIDGKTMLSAGGIRRPLEVSTGRNYSHHRCWSHPLRRIVMRTASSSLCRQEWRCSTERGCVGQEILIRNTPVPGETAWPRTFARRRRQQQCDPNAGTSPAARLEADKLPSRLTERT